MWVGWFFCILLFVKHKLRRGNRYIWVALVRQCRRYKRYTAVALTLHPVHNFFVTKRYENIENIERGIIRMSADSIGCTMYGISIPLLNLQARFHSHPARAPLTVSLCEKINESKKGARYIVMGIFILLYSIAVMIFLGFYADQVIMTIYGIVLMVVGRKTAKGNFAIA